MPPAVRAPLGAPPHASCAIWVSPLSGTELSPKRLFGNVMEFSMPQHPAWFVAKSALCISAIMMVSLGLLTEANAVGVVQLIQLSLCAMITPNDPSSWSVLTKLLAL